MAEKRTVGRKFVALGYRGDTGVRGSHPIVLRPELVGIMGPRSDIYRETAPTEARASGGNFKIEKVRTET